LVVYSRAVTFTAIVAPVAPASGTPSGTVVFSVDGHDQATVSLDASGHASLTLKGLAVGTHTVSARYGGDAGFGGASAALSERVIIASTRATLRSSLRTALV